MKSKHILMAVRPGQNSAVTCWSAEPLPSGTAVWVEGVSGVFDVIGGPVDREQLRHLDPVYLPEARPVVW